MITEKKDILRLILIRLIIVTSLLVSTVIIQSSTSVFLPLNHLYYLILTFYLLSFIYLVLYIWGKRYTLQASVQIFFDLVLITALVYISGGIQGSFYFLYIFEIIAASIVVSKRAAYLTAALSAIFFGLLVVFMYYGIIPYFPAGNVIEISYGEVINNIFVAWGAFFLVAFLMDYLTGSLKKAKEQLQRAKVELEVKKRLAAAGELAAQLAHEIRNPLAAISGSVQVLKDESARNGEHKELMSIVVEESRRISQSIEQFLSLASPMPRTFSSIDLSGILKETLTLLQNSGDINGNLNIEGNFESKSLHYHGNRNQFKQLFWNLLRNALKAMPDGGTLTIDMDKIENNEVQLKFTDTGIGMTVENKDKIFEPFYSGFENGRGIGMAVVRKIVDDYKGKIKVDSEPERGTEIIITLPIERA